MRQIMGRGHLIAALVAATVVLASSGDARSDEIEVGGRNVHHVTKAEWTEVGDREGHVIGWFEAVGVTFHADGEISTYTNRGTFDNVEQLGPNQGYIVRTWSDGSTISSSWRGETKLL